MNREATRGYLSLIGPALLVLGCADSSGPAVCSAGDVSLLADSICLDFSQAGSLIAYRATIQAEVERTVTIVNAHMPVDGIRIRIMANPASVIPEVGLGGYAPSGSEVRIFGDPSWPDVEQVIRSELLPILAHELHHARRWQTVGYGGTLFTAAVSEGLADHFAMQVAQIPARPWSTALTPEELEFWTARVLESSGGYNHADWFLGANPAIPRWAGYAVGYDLVRQHLESRPAETAASLVGEPAASFRP